MHLFLIGVKHLFYWVPFKTEITYAIFRASQVGLVVKDPPGNQEMWDTGSIPGLGRSSEGGYGNPLQHSCLESQHEQRSLGGYSPWGRRESHMHVCTCKIYCKKYWRSMQIWYCLIFNIKIPNKEDLFLDISFIYS